METNTRHAFLALLLAALLVLPGLSTRWFSTRGEPREALVAQAMLTTGDWTLPPSYAGRVPSKPPFLHWLIASASLPSGAVSELTARLPSALAYLAFACFFLSFVGRRLGAKQALGATMILCLSLEWLRAAHTCRVDMLFSAMLAGGLLALFAWEERRLAGTPYAAIALLSGATLTKGPAGIVLPGLIFALYLHLRRWSTGRAALSLAWVLAPAAAIPALWYVLAFFDGGMGFFWKFYSENVSRFSSSMDAGEDPHSHGILYLYGTLLPGLLPWSIVFAPLIVDSIWNWRLVLGRARASAKEAAPLTLFSALTVSCIVLFFSIPESKRSVYLLPAYPFIAILLQRYLPQGELFGEPRIAKAQRLACLIIALACLGASALLSFIAGGWSPAAPMLRDLAHALHYRLSAVGVALLSLAALAGVLELSRRRGAGALAGVRAASLYLIVVLAVKLAIVNPLSRQISPREFAGTISAVLPADARVLGYLYDFYGVSFYSGRLITPYTQQSAGGAHVLVWDRDREMFERELPEGLRTVQLARSDSGLEKLGERLSLVRLEGQGQSRALTEGPGAALE